MGKETEDWPAGMMRVAGVAMVASVRSSEVRVTARFDGTGEAVVMVASAALFPEDSEMVYGVMVRDRVLVMEVADAWMLSMAMPELVPPSEPRQTAQRIWMLGWLSVEVGSGQETLDLMPVVPPAWENGFEPEDGVRVVHGPVVPMRNWATMPMVRGCALTTSRS